MSRRIIRSVIAATIGALVATGMPGAAHAGTSNADTFLGKVDLTGPDGLILRFNTQGTNNLFENQYPDGAVIQVEVTNTTSRAISGVVTRSAIQYTNLDINRDLANQFTLNPATPDTRTQIIASGQTKYINIGRFDFSQVAMYTQGNPLYSTKISVTFSEASTLNWTPMREALKAAGFEPGTRGWLTRSEILDDGSSVVYSPSGAQFPVCNRNGYPRLLRIKNVTFGGTEVPAGVGVYQILPNDCVNLYLGDPASLFGQTNLAIDAVIGDDFEFDYSAFDEAMAPLHIRRTGKAVVIPDALAVGSQAAPNAKAYVPVCSDLSSATTPVNTVTGLSWVTGGNVLIDSNTTKPNTIITALCNEGESTNWPLPDIATDGYAATVEHPDSPLRLNLTILGLTPYIVPPRLTEASKYDWSDVYAQLTALGFRSLNNGMMIGDPNDSSKRLLQTMACNSTSSTKYVRVKATTVGDVSYLYDQPYVRSIAAGACAYVTVGQTNPLPLSYNGAKLTVLFGPEYMFDTSTVSDSPGLDEALLKAGLKRVGDITVDIDPDDVTKQIVEVPVCTRGKKGRSIFVGYTLVTVGQTVWGARNDEIQKISGSCPSGGNTLLLGSYSSAVTPLAATAGVFQTLIPQLVAAKPSIYSASRFTVPAGVTLSVTPAMAKYSAAGSVTSNNGTTEIWAAINVPLAKKGKTYTLSNVLLNNTSVGPVVVKGACKTVKVGKAQMCQRRVKLGTIEGNWLYSKTLNITGALS